MKRKYIKPLVEELICDNEMILSGSAKSVSNLNENPVTDVTEGTGDQFDPSDARQGGVFNDDEY